MKRTLLGAVRAIHVLGAPSRLPRRLAIYFHALERSDHVHFFEAMRVLMGLGFRTVDARRFVEPEGDDLRLFLSFDDNYRSWHTSLDLFARLGVTATFYVNSRPFRDSATPGEIADFFERTRHHGEPLTLSRAELRDLHAAGHTIGCHTHTHPMLSRLAPDRWADEIDRSKRIIEDCIAARVDDFSYPYGMRRHFSAALRAHCVAAGFSTIATGLGGLQHVWPADPLAIHRTGWKLDRSVADNLDDLRVDARLFARATGRSAVG